MLFSNKMSNMAHKYSEIGEDEAEYIQFFKVFLHLKFSSFFTICFNIWYVEKILKSEIYITRFFKLRVLYEIVRFFYESKIHFSCWKTELTYKAYMRYTFHQCPLSEESIPFLFGKRLRILHRTKIFLMFGNDWCHMQIFHFL
jgi:hypothetical protein